MRNFRPILCIVICLAISSLLPSFCFAAQFSNAFLAIMGESGETTYSSNPVNSQSGATIISSPDFDLSPLSYEELLILQSAVEKALEEKSLENGSFKVSSGKYLIGEDIPAGTYRCECKGAYSSTILHVYEKESDIWPIVSEVMAELYGSSVIGKLVLKDGYILEIDGSALDFIPYANTVQKQNTSLPTTNADQMSDYEMFRTAAEESKAAYEKASSALATQVRLLSSFGKSIVASEKDQMLSFCDNMYSSLESGITNSTAASMEYFKTLFSYGGSNPVNDPEYQDIIGVLNFAYNDALAAAKERDEILCDALTAAFEDNRIDSNEYSVLSACLEAYNEVAEF